MRTYFSPSRVLVCCTVCLLRIENTLSLFLCLSLACAHSTQTLRLLIRPKVVQRLLFHTHTVQSLTFFVSLFRSVHFRGSMLFSCFFHGDKQFCTLLIHREKHEVFTVFFSLSLCLCHFPPTFYGLSEQQIEAVFTSLYLSRSFARN